MLLPGAVTSPVDNSFFDQRHGSLKNILKFTIRQPKCVRDGEASAALTLGAKAAGRFGKQDFIYVAAEDIYRCPAGERLTYRFTVEAQQGHAGQLGTPASLATMCAM
jgi:hypothetical protein